MGKKAENQLGLLAATSYIVATIIGSGIFVSPKGILAHAGSVGLSLIIWLVCALLSIVDSITYTELASSIPESGAELAYLNYVGWDPISFSFLWLSAAVQSSCSGSVLFLTFGEYIVQGLEPITCLEPEAKDLAIKFFGFGLFTFLTIVNNYALSKFAGRIQVVSMFSKLVAVSLIIGTGFYFLIFKGDTAHFQSDYIFKGSNFSAVQIVLAIYQGNWAYAGYTTLNYGTEEVQLKNFKKVLPIAVTGGLAIASIIYILANIAYFTVLTPEEIMKSDAVATLFMQKTLGAGAGYAMPVLVGFLLVGTLNGDIFGWSRLFLAGSRRGMMPTALGIVHPENDSPRVAIWTHTILCMGCAFIGNVDKLIDYLTVIGIMSRVSCMCVLILIKWKKIPVAKTAIKFHMGWVILNLIISIVLLLTPIINQPIESAIGLGLFIIGIVGYYIFIYPKRRFATLVYLDDVTTRVCQLLFWGVVDQTPTYAKESEDNEKTDTEIFTTKL